MIIFSIGLCLPLIGVLEGEGILVAFMADNFINVFLSVYVITSLNRLKDTTWYSAEGLNLETFRRLGYDKYAIYKEKQKFHYIVMFPYVLLYMIIPLIAAFFMDTKVLLFAILRVPFIYLFISTIIDYFILSDTENPRTNKYDPVSNMGIGNILTLIVMFHGIGLSYLIINAGSGEGILSNIENVEWALYLLVLVPYIILKLRHILKSKKLKGKFEGGKVYG